MLRRSSWNFFNKVVVFGGGTMGGGIAQISAQAGVQVSVVEKSDGLCARSKQAIASSLNRISKKFDEPVERTEFMTNTLNNITFTSEMEQATVQADLIIEAVVEDVEVKQALWKKIDPIAKTECVFATNTSSLSVFDQASVTQRPDRFGGLHFFSPVPMMKLVEVVVPDACSQATTDSLKDFAIKLGKTPVITKDTKGFVVNRLLIPSLLEACRLVERGVASVEDTDVAMRNGAGHPMGPFQLADSIGLDVIKLVSDSWFKADPENALFLPSSLIDAKVAKGKLGRKTGEGFYKY